MASIKTNDAAFKVVHGGKRALLKEEILLPCKRSNSTKALPSPGGALVFLALFILGFIVHVTEHLRPRITD